MSLTAPCSFGGCGRPHKGRSTLCAAHRLQEGKGGPLRPLRAAPRRSDASPLHDLEGPALVEAIRASLVVEDPDTRCWLWQGYVDRNGYGKANHRGISWWAHRLTFFHAYGTLRRGQVVHHAGCKTRACVNPAHLQAVSAPENIAETTARRSWEAALDGHFDRLDEARQEVAELRAALEALDPDHPLLGV